jgi:hypothetical protein
MLLRLSFEMAGVSANWTLPVDSIELLAAVRQVAQDRW